MSIEMRRKYAFAMRRNWSHSDFGSHVYQVYFVVEMLFAATFDDPVTRTVNGRNILNGRFRIQDTTEADLTSTNIHWL
jgi:hypothetical protein